MFGCWPHYKSYFNANPSRNALIYLFFTFFFVSYSFVALLQPVLQPPSVRTVEACVGKDGGEEVKWPNPKYNDVHCLDDR
eukprot:605542-Prorocentrum_minimum.AAC.3